MVFSWPSGRTGAGTIPTQQKTGLSGGLGPDALTTGGGHVAPGRAVSPSGQTGEGQAGGLKPPLCANSPAWHPRVSQVAWHLSPKTRRLARAPAGGSPFPARAKPSWPRTCMPTWLTPAPRHTPLGAPPPTQGGLFSAPPPRLRVQLRSGHWHLCGGKSSARATAGHRGPDAS